jgi:divalent metal cation (Fe/Co/Zn/Cd) transporter
MRASANAGKLAPSLERRALIRQAFRLEWFTIFWMMIEGAVAIATGAIAHSLLLLAFGIDSIIELASAGVLFWRLSVELRDGRAFSEEIERRAGRIAGGLLFALAVYVIAAAAWGLWQHPAAEFSLPGLILAVAAIPIMYFLSKRKLAVAKLLGSRALRADAFEGIACGWLSFTVVIGLIAQLALHAWWVDSVASLAIVYFLIKEGREAWEGEGCDDDCAHDES